MQFKLKYIFLSLLLFASVLFFVFAYYSYEKNVTLLLERQSLETATKAHAIKDEIAASFHDAYKNMKNNEEDEVKRLYFVANEIEKNPSLSLEDLKKNLNSQLKDRVIDIFLIDKDYKIFKTTFAPDLGLDFHTIPITLKSIDDVFFRKVPYDISKPTFTYSQNNHITLNKYFLIKPKNLDFMVQIGVKYNAFDGFEIDKHARKIMPNLLSYDMFSLWSNDSGASENVVSIISSNHLYLVQQKCAKTDYYKKFIDSSLKFKYIYEKITNKKYQGQSRDAIYFDTLNVLKQNKNMIILQNSSYSNQPNSTIVFLPMRLYKTYIDNASRDYYFLMINIDNSPSINEAKQFKIVTILYFVLIFALFSLIVLVFYTKVFSPLLQVQKVMSKNEKIENSLIKNSKNELGDVMITYNNLHDRLEKEIKITKKLLENLKNFTSNSIHQIKTPMSILNIYTEMLKDSNANVNIKANLQSSILMINHIHDTINYKIQKDYVEFKPDTINFSEILNSQIGKFSVIAKGYNKKIHATVKDDIFVFFNKTELSHIIDNNLSNAIKYGKLLCDIFVELKKDGDFIIFSVANDGDEIIGKDEVFERFNRQSISEAIGGSGIGLDIVREICAKYAVEIELAYENGKNKFIYKFKLAKA